ncbi:MAG: hypothetical protein LBV78_20175, partial [Kitasatospora sp.]|nr:hypothetical protein [Kitasatospora sp.]
MTDLTALQQTLGLVPPGDIDVPAAGHPPAFPPLPRSRVPDAAPPVRPLALRPAARTGGGRTTSVRRDPP